MNWSDVGGWLKDNAGSGVAMVGSLLTGNYPAAIAQGAALIAKATGTDDPQKALEALQTDPNVMLRLRELAVQEAESIREHHREMKRMELQDEQRRHEVTQQTVRAGDAATDEKLRWVRPDMAQQSWKATVAYCLVSAVTHAFTDSSIFMIEIAGLLSAPAFAYLGLRTYDKRNIAKFTGVKS